MKIPASQLLADLKARTEQVLQAVQPLHELTEEQLNWRASQTSWSILECLEHLNLYGDYYLPEITRRMAAAPKNGEPTTFRSGLIGNYFAKMMLPGEQMMKIKTFQDKNPLGSNLTHGVLDRFEAQQRQLLDLLHQAARVDLTRVKTSISISSLLKLRLGDTFRVMVYHNQRHLEQARRVLAQQPQSAKNFV